MNYVLKKTGFKPVFCVLEGGHRGAGGRVTMSPCLQASRGPGPKRVKIHCKNCWKGKYFLQNLVNRMHKFRFGEMCSKVWVPLRLSKSLQKATVNMFVVVLFALVLFRTRSWNPCKNQCETVFWSFEWYLVRALENWGWITANYTSILCSWIIELRRDQISKLLESL